MKKNDGSNLTISSQYKTPHIEYVLEDEKSYWELFFRKKSISCINMIKCIKRHKKIILVIRYIYQHFNLI